VWFDAQLGDPFCPSVPHERLEALVIEEHQLVPARAPDGHELLHTYWPIALDAGRTGGLELSKSTAELAEKKRIILLQTAAQMGVTVLVAGVVTVLIGLGVVGRPLRLLIDKTRRVAAGDLTGPVEVNTRDELAELAESLNQMCARLARSQAEIRDQTAARIAAMDQLRHADRLKTVGRLASGMAHELGTPLNVVSGRAGLIASGKLPAGEIVQSAEAIKAEADRMTTIIRQLLDFARRSTPQKAPVDLREIAADTIDLLSAIAAKHQVTLSLVDGDKPAIAQVDFAQIQQVLTNLLLNAIQAMPDGGRVQVDVRRRLVRPPEGHEGGENDYLRVCVEDEGRGISAEDLEHVFEPFFTTKDVGEGTGLGLSIAYGIVQEHGGWIDVSSEPGRGSCFSVYLPPGEAP
jgi:signal transduction histidine kinase